MRRRSNTNNKVKISHNLHWPSKLLKLIHHVRTFRVLVDANFLKIVVTNMIMLFLKRLLNSATLWCKVIVKKANFVLIVTMYLKMKKKWQSILKVTIFQCHNRKKNSLIYFYRESLSNSKITLPPYKRRNP